MTSFIDSIAFIVPAGVIADNHSSRQNCRAVLTLASLTCLCLYIIWLISIFLVKGIQWFFSYLPNLCSFIVN